MDKTFDFSKVSVCALSVQMSPVDLSYCIYDTVVGKFIALQSYSLTNDRDVAATCRDILAIDEYLRLNFKTCHLAWASPRATLTPAFWASEKNAEELLNFNHGTARGETTFVRRLPRAGCMDFFSVPTDILQEWEAVQPQMHVMHHAQPLVEWSIVCETPVTLYLFGRYMDVVITRNGKLLFYNTFEVRYPSEALYFVAASLERFEQKASVEVTLSGISDTMEIRKCLMDNGIRIAEPEPDDRFAYSRSITDEQQRRFVHLFNLRKCAS